MNTAVIDVLSETQLEAAVIPPLPCPEAPCIINEIEDIFAARSEVVHAIESISPQLTKIDEADFDIKAAQIQIEEAKKIIEEKKKECRPRLFEICHLMAIDIYNHCKSAEPKLRKNQIESRIRENYLDKKFDVIKHQEEELRLYAKLIVQSVHLEWDERDWDLFLEKTQSWDSKIIITLLTKLTTRESFFVALSEFSETIPTISEIENYRQTIAPTKIHLDRVPNPKTIDLVTQKCPGLSDVEISQSSETIREKKIQQLISEDNYREGTEIPVTWGEIVPELIAIDSEKYSDKLSRIIAKSRRAKQSSIEKKLEEQIKYNQRLEIELKETKLLNSQLLEAIDKNEEKIENSKQESKRELTELLIEIGVISGSMKEQVFNILAGQDSKNRTEKGDVALAVAA